MKQTLKRLLALVLVLCTVLATAVTAFAAEDSTKPAATLSISGVKKGEQVVVSISMTGCTGVSGVQVNVDYDTSRLTYDSFSDAALINGGADAYEENGTVRLAFGPGGDDLTDKTGTLGTLTFNIGAEAEGDAVFTMSGGKVTNTSGVKAPISENSTSTATVCVDAEPLPEVNLTSIEPFADGIVIRWDEVAETDYYEVYSKCEDGAWSKLANTRSLAYKDTTPENDKTYSYTVLARNGKRVSPWNEANILTVKKGLDGVVMSEPQPHVTGNIIRWEKVEYAAFYQVLRLDPGSSTWTLLKNTSGTAYKDETAETGIKYYYKVRARKGDLMSTMAIQSVSAIRPIGNVTMGETTSHYTGNIVRWSAVDNAKSYQVYRLASGGSSWSLLAKTTGTAYKDTSAAYGTKYYYKVVAVCNSAVGSLNNVSSVSAVRPPQNVALTGAKAYTGGIVVRWSAVEGATRYQVLRRTANGDWTHLAYTTGTAYKDTTAKAGTTYYYTVRSVAGSTYSASYDKNGVSAKAI